MCSCLLVRIDAMEEATVKIGGTTFRQRLDGAAERLELLAVHSSPLIASLIKLEVVAVREASIMLEDEPCNACNGRGENDRGACTNCGGTGAL